MRFKNKLVMLVSVALSFVAAFYFTGCKFQSNEQQIRTVTLEQSSIDYQSILNDFEDAELNIDGTFVDFVGNKKIDASVFEEIDNLGINEREELQENNNVQYHFTYDVETNIVTLEARATLTNGEIFIDTVEGVGFYNDKGEIDAVMNIDGEGILLSEMKDSGLIANAGWLSNLVKAAVAVVVVAVVVAAVAVAVVATVGAAAPAVVAVGVGVTAGTTAATAATIASVSLTVAAIAAGVAITAAIVNITFQGINYKMEEYSKIKSRLTSGLVFLAAASSDGKMYVSPIAVSVATGSAAYAAGLSTYSINPAQAIAVCVGVAGSTTNSENHGIGKGYFDHYHTWNRLPKNSHAFFGVPR